MYKPGTGLLPLSLLLFIACSIPANTSDVVGGRQQWPERSGSGGVNAAEQRTKPYLILISIDGFRWDYQDLYETPSMDRLSARGVRADALQPVFPTLTFPNHYSIATGLYPANHGIIANNFPGAESDDWYRYKRSDLVQQGRWYGGVPIWVAAERNGMVSAAFFFVGTEADIGGHRPSYWYPFDHKIPGSRRVEQVLKWLAMPDEARPHLITLYFEHVDDYSHHYGVGSKESIREIERVDDYLSDLMDGIDELPFAENVYIILLSDHGQSGYDVDAKVLVLDKFLNLEGISIVEGGSYAYLFFDKKDPARAIRLRDDINRVWQHGRAWLAEETPESWHVIEPSRFPDIIVQPDPHFGVVSDNDHMHEITRGAHGWDPSFRDMHGIFIAAGPRLPKGTRIGTISNLDVYPLMLEILELPLATPIDGNTNTLAGLLDPR